MKTRVSLTFTLSLSLFLPLPVLAKPLTKADIEGKTICFGYVTNVFNINR